MSSPTVLVVRFPDRFSTFSRSSAKRRFCELTRQPRQEPTHSSRLTSGYGSRKLRACAFSLSRARFTLASRDPRVLLRLRCSGDPCGSTSASVPPQNTRDSLREGSTSPPIRRIRQELPLTLRRQAAPLLPQSPACSINVPVLAEHESTDTCAERNAGPARPRDFSANTNQRQKSHGLPGPGSHQSSADSWPGKDGTTEVRALAASHANLRRAGEQISFALRTESRRAA